MHDINVEQSLKGLGLVKEEFKPEVWRKVWLKEFVAMYEDLVEETRQETRQIVYPESQSVLSWLDYDNQDKWWFSSVDNVKIF